MTQPLGPSNLIPCPGQPIEPNSAPEDWSGCNAVITGLTDCPTCLGAGEVTPERIHQMEDGGDE